MAIKLEEFRVTNSDGEIVTYEVNQMAGRKALKAFTYWVGIIGNLMSDEDIMANFMQNMDSDKLIDEVEKLLGKEVLRNGREVNFDEDYRGNLSEAFEISIKVLKFNFESLWGSSLGKVMSGLKS